jgi:hypothetical protein
LGVDGAGAVELAAVDAVMLAVAGQAVCGRGRSWCRFRPGHCRSAGRPALRRKAVSVAPGCRSRAALPGRRNGSAGSAQRASAWAMRATTLARVTLDTPAPP